MNIKIIKCGSPMLWYSEQVGRSLPLVAEDEEGYWTREPAGYLNVIRKEDAVLEK